MTPVATLAPPLTDSYEQCRYAEQVARWARLLLVRAATFLLVTQDAVATELGISQPAVSQQLAATKIAHVQRLDRGLLLDAAPPALEWLAARMGFDAIEARDCCWHPQPEPAAPATAPDDPDASDRAWIEQATAWLFGESLVASVDEPPIDVFVRVPVGLARNEVEQLRGMAGRLLRREVVMHSQVNTAPAAVPGGSIPS
ncbi:hypothetical protein [Branchiibius sp. NY16-3462-2]|uniref:hypothetical protein n=1 Tax=Branchiibius sp. NY16-3462-2 TaxID=1807500 RepID=UPI00079B58B0|nr:hypothetical protein [Branchiibius sp. NY16-3462-2]KYH45082.1 hypothetical protein AZH51_14450 [Branchiibius sp. NY16-3462-2]